MNPTSRKLLSMLLTLAAILCLGSAVKPAQAQTRINPEDGAKKDACEVCHNGNNPHTVLVPCNNVNTYLANHPGDYVGPCHGVTDEKPPKPSPSPKP